MQSLDVLIGCEYSGTVRDAYLAKGHNAYSNDIIDTDTNPERHLKMDIIDAIRSKTHWDRIIIHIPCKAMAVCGNKHYARGMPKHSERLEALEWSLKVWDVACAHSDHVAMENPASVLFSMLREERDAEIQYIQPYHFGHLEQKKTGLATKNLPRLKGTNDVYEEMIKLPVNVRERVFYMAPSADRGKERARFYKGFAEAFADQW